jgi:hypothetical protein
MVNKVHPGIIIIGLIIVLLLYKNGFLASFITTCNNVEPDTTSAFSSMFSSMNITTSSTAPSLVYKEIVIDENNNTVARDVTLQGLSYGGFNVYDTSNCESVITYLLIAEEARVRSSFVSQLVIPDYDPLVTYYDSDHVALTSTPVDGQEYYSLIGEDYVKMPTPYMTTPPTLKDNPYQIYTPVDYQTIKAKVINSRLFWCSNNERTLLMTSNPYYESISRYGESVIQCETVYVNDTQVAIDACAVDNGVWTTSSICKCSDNSPYEPGITCPSTVTVTGSGGEETVITSEPGSSRKINTNTIIGIIILVGLVAYIAYFAITKKKHKK